MAVDLAEADKGELSLYFDTREGELVDLEVAAGAAIQWAQGLKAAAAAVDPDCEYRVSLLAAEPGSSKWIAMIERSAANRAAKRVSIGWKRVPLILRLGIGLAVVVPTTAKPTLDYWLGNDGFSDTQKREMREIYGQAVEDPAVKAHRKSMYQTAPRDQKITGIGTGVPTGKDWKPPVIPASQFAEADGLFDPQPPPDAERIIRPELDVILVAPRLEAAPKAWLFRQEGMPGTFSATMRDKRFLAALENDGVRETLRAEIPMRVRLEIKQRFVDGEWKVKRRGRAVVEVLSPKVN